jgi:hypothetical protein
MGGSASLFEPVEAVAMALAVDEIKFAIVVDVVAEDRKTSVTKVPVPVPKPLVAICVDLLESAMGRQDVGFTVAVDVGDADAVPSCSRPPRWWTRGLSVLKSTHRTPARL